ncbi:MAG: DUF3616 domain-containing protein [Planctomycetota bacterium]|jgi:hypothetical protein
MKAIIKVVFLVSMWGTASLAGAGGPAGEKLVFREASDASAAVAIAENMFIVADDENNVLRIYRTDNAGPPVFSYDLTEFLDIDPEHPEADIEGATMIGSRIYWITSHGRNKDGKMRPNRYRFFATDVSGKDGEVAVLPVGKPYRGLAHELLKIPNAGQFGLDRATRFGEGLSKKEREKLAPKEEGLNIEGLCASADGKTVYIGLRNPKFWYRSAHHSFAIAVPLKNPDGVLERGERPVFGAPDVFHLDNLGIRSMEYSRFHKEYFIIAGSSDEDDEFGVYRWSGGKKAASKLVRGLKSDSGKFTPEALVPFADGRLLVLSDDGSVPIRVSGPSECLPGEYRKDGTCLNKYLADPAKKTFRGIWLTP